MDDTSLFLSFWAKWGGYGAEMGRLRGGNGVVTGREWGGYGAGMGWLHDMGRLHTSG